MFPPSGNIWHDGFEVRMYSIINNAPQLIKMVTFTIGQDVYEVMKTYLKALNHDIEKLEFIRL